MAYIHLKTELPHPLDLKFIKDLNKVSPKSMQEGQLPVVWKKAHDFLVYDRWGNTFIDFTSCIFVANSGHSNANILNSIRKQINAELIHSYTFPTEIKLKYLQHLTSYTGYEKAFLLSAGTEATEAACKIMRTVTKRNIVFSFRGAMHGKTFFAEALKGTYNEQYVHLIEYPKPFQRWKDLIKDLNYYFVDNSCGIIIESYRGWDANFFVSSFIQEVYEWIKKHKMLICFDEIQAGFGRTGKTFAYDWYNIPKPDLVCCGKGLGGGVPISAVLGSKKLLDSVKDLSSTNSANPLVCSAALANLENIESHHLIKNAYKLGKVLADNLKAMSERFEIITNYNSTGLVAALIFPTTTIADAVCYRCMQKGLLLVHTGRESVKIGPPLVISQSALEEGLDVLENVLEGVSDK